MFSSLLIANRGEIACRIIGTAHRIGLHTVAVYSDADARARHVALADRAIGIGPPEPRESYLKIEAIIAAAKEAGAEAIHPGYGFLSENAAFAEACAKAGIVFVGPPPEAIRAMGLKGAAKALMEKAGVPVVPGYHGERQDIAHLKQAAKKIGYPVLIKAVAGGGGKGMRRIEREADFEAALASAQREAKSAFGDDRVLVERYVAKPRHIEIQVFADKHGGALALFERDCSLQRRHQKVIEEAPAPGMPPEMRARMGDAAVKAARAVGYVGAGTVEFIADASEGLRADRYYFMEMNTRLQVEHRVTELVTGTDLVEWQLRVAAGEKLPAPAPKLDGAAIEVRLYAEDPAKSFFPSPGHLHRLQLPQPAADLVVDTGVREGDEVTLFYDPMIAKIVAKGETRERAIDRLRAALGEVEVAGVRTNASFLLAALGHPEFRAGAVDTGFIDRHLSALLKESQAGHEVLVAGALFLSLGAAPIERPTPGPWDASDGWRVNGQRAGASAPIRFQWNGEDVAVLLSFLQRRVEVRIGEERFILAFAHVPDEALEIKLEGQAARRYRFLRSGQSLFVMSEGASHELHIAPAFELGETAGEARAISAPLAGKIVQVQTKPGDAVKRGQPLVVLEAMKMEHTLVAEGEAVVESVAVKAGDQVREGQLIVAFAAA